MTDGLPERFDVIVHPAHELRGELRAQPSKNYTTRYLLAAALAVAEQIAAQQAAGRITDAIDPTTLARIFQAVTDGLQVQWMLEPDVDMAGTVDALFDALDPAQAGKDPERKAAPRGAAS